MRRVLIALWTFLPLGLLPAARAAASPPETVLLVHGMGRTRLSMAVLAWRLRREGFRVVSFPYNHAWRSLSDASARLRRAAAAAPGPYHLVGHSLGAVIIRDGFREGYPPSLGRVVMLAPPNAPAELAAQFRRNLVYRWITGDSGQRLAEPAFYASLPVPTVEFAVLAGDRGNRLWTSERNDGVVTVEGTRLSGMKDFAVLHKTHTFIMNSREAGSMVVSFLRDGRLSPPTTNPKE